MSRYTGPTHKISRRLNYSTLESGVELKKKNYPPGMHGKKKSKLSGFALELREKQKVRFNYGLTERQFKKYYEKAKKLKGKLGDNMLILLETRLDNIVYRAGFAETKRQARQLVNHGHILVDGKKVDIPSYQLSPTQVISPSSKAKEFKIIKENIEYIKSNSPYLTIDNQTLSATLTRLPERNEFLQDINEQLIVEFYSK